MRAVATAMNFKLKKFNKNYDVPFSTASFPSLFIFSMLYSNNPFFAAVAHLDVQVKIIIIKWYIMLLEGMQNIQKKADYFFYCSRWGCFNWFLWCCLEAFWLVEKFWVAFNGQYGNFTSVVWCMLKYFNGFLSCLVRNFLNTTFVFWFQNIYEQFFRNLKKLFKLSWIFFLYFLVPINESQKSKNKEKFNFCIILPFSSTIFSYFVFVYKLRRIHKKNIQHILGRWLSSKQEIMKTNKKRHDWKTFLVNVCGTVTRDTHTQNFTPSTILTFYFCAQR